MGNRQAENRRDEPRQIGGRSTRFTIGLVTDALANDFLSAMWCGAADAAQERNAHLVCFPAGGLNSMEEIGTGANVLYNLIDVERLDGLAIWGYLIRLPHGDRAAFYRRYGLPVVSIAQPVEGIPNVLVDNYGGMREVVTHLVEVHGCRRIAYVKGMEDFQEHKDRYRAYLDVLAEHGLSHDADLVLSEADRMAFSQQHHLSAGPATASILLDERRLSPGNDFDAMVCNNDNTAAGITRALQARGLRVPEDVALTGFDDTPEARCATPPITTAPFPIYDLGRQAVETLIDVLEGKEVAEQVLVPSRLIVRQSCGCLPREVVQAAVGSAAQSGVRFEDVSAARRGEIVSEMAQAAGASAEALDPDWAERLLAAFSGELQGEVTGAFLPALAEILRRMGDDGDVAAWQNVISALRRHALRYLGRAEELSRAETLWGQARAMIGEATARAQAYKALGIATQGQALHGTGRRLATTTDREELAALLIEELPRLGIQRFCLSLYEEPAATARWARLVLAYDLGRHLSLGPDERRFPAKQLLPEELWPDTQDGKTVQPHSLLVESLFFGEDQLGLAVFEPGPREGPVYDTLRGQISGALQVIHLFDVARQARLEAERADRLKTRLLANVSHELRTPLHVILDRVRSAMQAPQSGRVELHATLQDDLRRIHDSAEHQLRLINDLLDLSRAEIEALDLHPELIAPRALLEETFHSIADLQSLQGDVTWRLQLPDRLPVIQADPVRLRQVLLNLLSNARKFAERGEIVLGAEVTPQHLHVWVEDTGIGIPPDQQERIFEPFATVERSNRRLEGVGLGLSITRRLVVLHGGEMALESEPGQGSTFHVRLPLPSLSDRADTQRSSVQASASVSTLLLISAQDLPPPEIVAFGQRQGLAIRRLQPGDDVKEVLAEVEPAILACDLVGTGPGHWILLRQLRKVSLIADLPFILYGQKPGQSVMSMGLTDVVLKPVSRTTLVAAIEALCPPDTIGPVLIVDDDPQARASHTKVAKTALPGYSLRAVQDGQAALVAMTNEVPSIVILDLIMPGLDGIDVLEWMRENSSTQHVPVLVLSNRTLSLEDVTRLERHARVTVQSKGILSADETVASLHKSLFGADALPPHTGALVKRAMAYLHQNYTRSFSRQEMADSIGVSERYFTRVFRQELGLPPWEYLNRYRISQAKLLLDQTNDNITAVALQVGFNDPGYFGRMFRKLTGLTPGEYKRQGE